jgi:hypothetical protein
MIPTCPTELHQRRVQLTREPASAAEARSQVRAVITAWQVPVDPDIAVLLTSDLVTNAITCGGGETVTLGIRCDAGHLRIDVCDTSRAWPTAAGGTAGAETGRGLVLVATLATEWGSVRSPAGRSAYFTLAFLPRGSDGAAAGSHPWEREPRSARRPGQFAHSAEDTN